MKEIALVYVYGRDVYDDSCYDIIANSITEWTEISDEEYSLIRHNISHYNNELYKKCDQRAMIIEKPNNQQEEIDKTVRGCLDIVKKRMEEEEKRKKSNELRNKRREEKALERKRKKLEELKKELGDN